MSYPSDPQSLFEADLAAKGYVPLPPFAVIDECEFYDSRSRQHVKMDPARLAKMADAQNQRIVGRNDATPIILGHTEDYKDEANQPPIVGLATRFHVGTLPDGKAAVFARPWAAPGQVETFRKHPRRSVELWLDPDAIDPIALLGATTPRRDLGLHLFSRQYANAADATSGSVVRFSRSQSPGRYPVLFEMRTDMNPVKCDEPGAPPDGLKPDDGNTGPVEAGQDVKALSAKVDKLMAFMDKFAPILEQVLEEEAGEGGVDPNATGGPGPEGGFDAGPPSAPGGPPPAPGAGGPPSPPDREDGPIKKNAAGAPGLGGYSSAGYGNTAMPTHFAADPDTRVRLQRAEAQLTDANREIAALRLQRMEDETNALLDALDREGVTLDRDHDFKALVRMSKADRAAEADRMRRLRLKKAPAVPGDGKFVVSPEEVQGPVKFSRPADGIGLAGDPALKTAIPDDYDSLIAFAAQAKAQGVDLKTVTGLANGVKVR